MDRDRRLMLGAGLGLAAGAVAASAGPRPAAAAASPGVRVALVAGSDEDQSAILQQAIDAAAAAGALVVLPAGRFTIGGVELRSGTALVGAHGRSVLAQVADGPILSAKGAERITIEGLTLEGHLEPIEHESVRFEDCREIRIRDCGLRGELPGIAILGGGPILVTDLHVVSCRGTALSMSGVEGAVVSGCLIERAGGGIAMSGLASGGRLASIHGNLLRGIGSVGIAVEADCSITGNVIEGAGRAGILAGVGPSRRDVSIIGNLLRECGIGIALSGDPEGGVVFVSQNLISGAKNGAIRAMDGSAPIGPDLSRASAEAYPNLAILQNVATR